MRTVIGRLVGRVELGQVALHRAREVELALLLEDHRRGGGGDDLGERREIVQRRRIDGRRAGGVVGRAIALDVDEPPESSDGERGTGCGALLEPDADDAVESRRKLRVESDRDGRGGHEGLDGRQARRGGRGRRRCGRDGARACESKNGSESEGGEAHDVMRRVNEPDGGRASHAMDAPPARAGADSGHPTGTTEGGAHRAEQNFTPPPVTAGIGAEPAGIFRRARPFAEVLIAGVQTNTTRITCLMQVVHRLRSLRYRSLAEIARRHQVSPRSRCGHRLLVARPAPREHRLGATPGDAA